MNKFANFNVRHFGEVTEVGRLVKGCNRLMSHYGIWNLEGAISIETLEEFRLVKQELEFIYNEKAKGSIIRSRCQWIDENEKCSKFFLNQEKNNYNTKHIKALNVDNHLITIPEEILDSERKFYEKLYTNSS